MQDKVNNGQTFNNDGTDWGRTSLTPEQEDVLHNMEENGEIDIPGVNENWTEPELPKEHLPTEKTGTFSGERGNSEFVPNNENALAKMEEYGQSSVTYKNNNPDFTPFSIHETENGKSLDTNVEIGHMTENRENGKYEFGRRPAGTSHDPDYDLGNFAQADNELLPRFQEIYPDATIDDVVNYRKENNLVWNECSDGKSMQLVPREIHEACPHSGGVATENYLHGYSDAPGYYDSIQTGNTEQEAGAVPEPKDIDVSNKNQNNNTVQEMGAKPEPKSDAIQNNNQINNTVQEAGAKPEPKSDATQNNNQINNTVQEAGAKPEPKSNATQNNNQINNTVQEAGTEPKSINAPNKNRINEDNNEAGTLPDSNKSDSQNYAKINSDSVNNSLPSTSKPAEKSASAIDEASGMSM